MSIGEFLRGAREQRGETLADVAHALKLSVRQVDALEREDFDSLPGPAFVRGFLRNYARYMQLDMESRIAAIEFGGASRAVRLAAVSNASGEIPSGGLRARMSSKALFGVLGGMVLVLGLGWYFDWFKMDANTTTTAVPEPVVAGPAPSQRIAVPENVAPPSFLVLPGAESLPAREDEEEPNEALAQASTDTDTGSGSTETDPQQIEATETESPPTSEAVSSAATQAPEATTGRLTFKLGAESWIQVRDGSGTALFTGTGAAGTTRVVQGSPPFSVVVGNAGRVELDLDGRVVDLAPHISPGGVARMTVQ